MAKILNFSHIVEVAGGGEVTGEAAGVRGDVVDKDLVQVVTIVASYKVKPVCYGYTNENHAWRGQVRHLPPGLTTVVLVDLAAGQEWPLLSLPPATMSICVGTVSEGPVSEGPVSEGPVS